MFPAALRGLAGFRSHRMRTGVVSVPCVLEVDNLSAHGYFVFVLRNVSKYSFRVENEMETIILIPTLCGRCED